LKFALSIVVVLYAMGCASQPTVAGRPWVDFAADFATTYQSLELPPLRLGYATNLGLMQSAPQLENQRRVFETWLNELATHSIHSLTERQRLDYELIRYESQLNLERIELGLRWQARAKKGIPSDGLASTPMGKEWYLYFFKRWLDTNVTPEEIFALGEREVARVESEIEKIRVASGLSEPEFRVRLSEPAFFYDSPEQVRRAFEAAQYSILKKLPAYFPYVDSVGPAKIVRGTDEALAQTPAYYRDRSLNFNYFDAPFNRRKIYWIYLHEALPGHHYQLSLANNLEQSDIQKLFRYSVFGEGWGAYVEDLGVEVGLYDDVFSEIGKWEWDLIRSIRLVLDVGLNYYQWSDDKAMAYWKQHIDGQDDIGLREIARVKRWPVQVITYKYGAEQFNRRKREAQAREGFSFVEFHKELMAVVPVPFSLLNRVGSD